MYFKIPPHIIEICNKLRLNGFQSYIVGGAVRDCLLDLTPLDWDVTTDALPDQIGQLFPKTIATGKQFGTVTVVWEDQRTVEITTLRKDGPYGDGRRPDLVYFTDDLLQDLSRRDFTINAMAYNPFERRLIDPFKGSKDLKRKCLVTVGDPASRFHEDALRMLRLIRFKSTLGFNVEKKTRLALEARLINQVSPERIQVELSKMLLGQNLAPSLQLLYESGLMEVILPELAACSNVSAGDRHPHDLLGHSIMTAHFAYPNLTLRWAALLHDLGKLESNLRDHAQIGAEMAREILVKLRCANKLIDDVEILVAHHMFDLHPHSSERAFRRFIAKVGLETAYQLVKLRQADMAGMNGDPVLIMNFGREMESRLVEIAAQDTAFTLSDLDLDGQTLMNELNLSPGPLIGKLLNYLLDKVLDDPTLNQGIILVQLAQEHLESLLKNEH